MWPVLVYQNMSSPWHWGWPRGGNWLQTGQSEPFPRIKVPSKWTSLAVQCTSTTGGGGLSPGWRTKIPHATHPERKKTVRKHSWWAGKAWAANDYIPCRWRGTVYIRRDGGHGQREAEEEWMGAGLRKSPAASNPRFSSFSTSQDLRLSQQDEATDCWWWLSLLLEPTTESLE